MFARYSPLSRSLEVARRARPPLAYHRIEQSLARTQDKLAEQAIDLAREKLDLYVPDGAPPAAGYGLIVYIAPSSGPTRPTDWGATLDDHRVLFVSAQRSGNEMNVLDRRVPLAILAYDNVRARFAIDPQRVYVMGFSGGSHVAESLGANRISGALRMAATSLQRSKTALGAAFRHRTSQGRRGRGLR